MTSFSPSSCGRPDSSSFISSSPSPSSASKSTSKAPSSCGSVFGLWPVVATLPLFLFLRISSTCICLCALSLAALGNVLEHGLHYSDSKSNMEADHSSPTSADSSLASSAVSTLPLLDRFGEDEAEPAASSDERGLLSGVGGGDGCAIVPSLSLCSSYSSSSLSSSSLLSRRYSSRSRILLSAQRTL